jgi:VCBS repeat-containing protein
VLAVDAAVGRGDVVETADDGLLALRFDDGTGVIVGGGSRFASEACSGDAAASDPSVSLVLFAGAAAVTAGAAAHAGVASLTVDTPVARLAVREGPLFLWFDPAERVLYCGTGMVGDRDPGEAVIWNETGLAVVGAPLRLALVANAATEPLLTAVSPDESVAGPVWEPLVTLWEELEAAAFVTAAGDEAAAPEDTAGLGPIALTSDVSWPGGPRPLAFAEPVADDDGSPVTAGYGVRHAAELVLFAEPLQPQTAQERFFPTRLEAMGGPEGPVSAWSEVGGWSGLVPTGVEHRFEHYRVVPSHVERLVSGPPRVFLAPERPGSEPDMLVMSAGSLAPLGLDGGLPGATVSDLESFLGLPSGALGDREPSAMFAADSDDRPVAGTFITTTMTIPAGQTLTFDLLFDPYDGEVYNDFAFLAVGDRVFTIASHDTADGVTGWRTIAYGVDETTTTRIAIGVVDAGDLLVHPHLLVDNVRIDQTDIERLVTGADGSVTVIDRQAGSTLLILAPNPTPGSDDIAVLEGATRTVPFADLLGNDAEVFPPHLDAAPVSTLRINGLDAGGTRGEVTLAGSGIVYAAANFDELAVGEVATDSFRYRAEALGGGQAWATVTVTVTGVNDEPVAVTDSAVVTAGDAAALDVLANDVDPDSDDDASTLQVVSARSALGAAVATGGPGAPIVYATGAVEALVALALGETATDVLTYIIADRHGATSEGSAEVRIDGRNDRPLVADVALSASEGAGDVRVDLLRAASDPDRGDVLDLGTVSQVSGPPVAIAVDGGVLIVSVAGLDAIPTGAAETLRFAYTVDDGRGTAESTAKATVILTVTGENDAPAARPDLFTVAAGGERIGSVFADNTYGVDIDVDRDDTITVVAVDGVDADVGRVLDLPLGGTVRIGADGSLAFDASGVFAGLAAGDHVDQEIAYTIADDHGATATATVRLRVEGANDAPVAAADAAVADADAAVRMAVLANDLDPDAGDVLSVQTIAGSVVRFPGERVALDSGATVRLNPDHTLTYDPGSAFLHLGADNHAQEMFSYEVADGAGATSVADVTVTVRGLRDETAGSTLVQSFEATDPVTGWLADWGRSGTFEPGAPDAIPVRIVAAYVANEDDPPVHPSHADAMVLISSERFAGDGALSAPGDIERVLGLDAHAIASQTGLSPNTGGVMFTDLWLEAGQTLSFDWTFVSGEQGIAASRNDFSVFTVAGPEDGRVFALADVSDVFRQTGAVDGAIGPYTAVYRHDGEAGSYRIGVAVFNEGTDFADSRILVDDIRLDATVRGHDPSGDDFQIVAPPPRPVDDDLATAEDDAVSIPLADLAANDRPSSAGGPFSLSQIEHASIGAGADGTVPLPSGATVSVVGGVLTWDPGGAFDGLSAGAEATDLFFYTVVAGNGATAEAAVTVHVEGRNDPPRAGDALIFFTDDEAAAFDVDLLAGADDPDEGDDLAVAGFLQTAGPPIDPAARTVRTLTLDPAGFGDVAPDAALLLQFRYLISDGQVPVNQMLTIVITDGDAAAGGAEAGSASDGGPLFAAGAGDSGYSVAPVAMATPAVEPAFAAPA